MQKTHEACTNFLDLNEMCAKFKIFLLAMCGEIIILAYKCKILRPVYGINTEHTRTEKVIISLTSYGRRVQSVLPYTICSLLRQSYKPDMILLWLDHEYWSNDNIPPKLRRLQKYGLSIKFFEDIKSYKKLIPTLDLLPDDIIITCDDDVFYKKHTISQLIDAHRSRPDCIICHQAHCVTLDEHGTVSSYNNWIERVVDSQGKQIFPIGVGGCLYKREWLHIDICCQNLFMKLAPLADDVWFYFMAHLKGTERYVLPHKSQNFIPLDVFYQKFHKSTSLSSMNVKQSHNDMQIRAVMSYYNIQAVDLVDGKALDACSKK